MIDKVAKILSDCVKILIGIGIYCALHDAATCMCSVAKSLREISEHLGR